MFPLFQVNSYSSLKIAIVVVCSRISAVGLALVACGRAIMVFFFTIRTHQIALTESGYTLLSLFDYVQQAFLA